MGPPMAHQSPPRTRPSAHAEPSVQRLGRPTRAGRRCVGRAGEAVGMERGNPWTVSMFTLVEPLAKKSSRRAHAKSAHDGRKAAGCKCAVLDSWRTWTAHRCTSQVLERVPRHVWERTASNLWTPLCAYQAGALAEAPGGAQRRTATAPGSMHAVAGRRHASKEGPTEPAESPTKPAF